MATTTFSNFSGSQAYIANTVLLDEALLLPSSRLREWASLSCNAHLTASLVFANSLDICTLTNSVSLKKDCAQVRATKLLKNKFGEYDFVGLLTRRLVRFLLWEALGILFLSSSLITRA